ncbi:MAG: hypothetical protein M1453_09215 [Acidobacteria bacterium]|nr:hypothetical protein [Acidobacteriota bacterium]MCL5288155.1 hypothetical protein [Acidobacteriota bacterium]
MTDSPRLRRECEVFCRYLIGCAPSAYVREKYCQAHERCDAYSSAAAFDDALLGFAARGPAFARLADSYACLFARYSSFRRKLILLFSILESSGAQHGFSDAVDGSTQPILFLKFASRGVLYVLRFVLASLIFVPMRLALGSSPPAARRGH